MSDWGIAIEELARDHAANYGVPDFVYDPVEVRKGDAGREVSDGLLIAGSRGLILQSKSRKLGKADSDQRIRSWLDKQIEDAARQVSGTRRTLGAGRIELVSRRGLPLTLDEKGSGAWPGLILVDGGDTSIPGDYVPNCEEPDCIVITHDDWLGLNQRIRSTIGVIQYVQRVLDDELEAPVLGHEHDRYTLLASADAGVVEAEGGYPNLPADPVPSDDEFYLALFGEWIDEDINNPDLEPADPDSVRRAIEVLDAIPVSLRAALGRALIDRTKASLVEQRIASGILGWTGSTDRVLFFQGHQHQFPTQADWDAEVFAYAAVRHLELEQIQGPGATLLLARMATRTQRSARTFVYLNERELDIPDDVRRGVLERRGVLVADLNVVDPSSIGRNDPCPCESGLKWKKCHIP